MAYNTQAPQILAPPERSKRRNSVRLSTVMPAPASWRQLAEEQKTIGLAAKNADTINAIALANGGADVKRWDGMARRTTPWNGLRRDNELWFPDADCNIHLCARGHSRRGPSFRVPYSAILAARCEPLLDLYYVPDFPTQLESDGSSSPVSSSDSGFLRDNVKYDLYIPAPRHMDKEEAFKFHLCTRNFFAWMFNKALVGRHLGGALVDLLERMSVFRSVDSDNLKDVVEYLNTQAYADFRECPNHALAGLFFAEHSKVVHLWRDAFVHCVGMDERLLFSSEFEYVSKTSKAMITRAKLEMDLRMDHVGRSLGAFLEDEFSGNHASLPSAAIAHMDHFRSFLHSFYVQKFGYWPPAPKAQHNFSYSKETYRSMYFEFRSLYQYLANTESSSESSGSSAPATLDISAAIKTYDQRHKYNTLPYTEPLIPEEVIPVPMKKFEKRKSIAAFLFGRSKPDTRAATVSALSDATNRGTASAMGFSLVRAYTEFEIESVMKAEEKISVADARRVRWLLVYAILQSLISVTRAPTEVSDTQGVAYSLCAQLAGTPPWKVTGTKPTKSDTAPVKDSSISKDDKASDVSRASLLVPRTWARGGLASPSVPDLAHLQKRNSSALSLPGNSNAFRPSRPNFSEILVRRYGNGTTADTAKDTAASNENSPTASNSADTATASSVSRNSTSDEDAASADDVDDMDHLSVSSSWYGDDRDDFVPRALEINKKEPILIVNEAEEQFTPNKELEAYFAA